MSSSKMKVMLLLTIILSFGLLAVGCSEDSEDTDNAETEATTEKAAAMYYEDNEYINMFVNNYNESNPDDTITADMIEKDEHHGKVHDDQVNILKEDNFEVNLSGSAYMPSMKVFIKGYDSQTNDEYKEVFMKYAKGYSPDLDDETLESYWDNALNGSTDSDVIDLYINESSLEGDIGYMTIEGDIQE